MNVTFRQLRLFLALAEHGSITAAARACHVTQPTVSIQLRELSEAVGLPLVAVPLLSLGMPPQVAIAWLVVPVLVSNAWQAVEGGAVRPTLKRFSGLLVAGVMLAILRGRRDDQLCDPVTALDTQ